MSLSPSLTSLHPAVMWSTQCSVLLASSWVLGVTGFLPHPPASEIEKAFKEHKIVPDIIDKAPEKFIYVKFRTPKSVYYVRLGTQIHPMVADEPPENIEWKTEPGAYYSLFHLGPNVGSETAWNESNFLHFCKVNIFGDDWKHTGHLIAEYVGSRPFPEYGNPYYVYLVYKQPKLIDFEEIKDIDDYMKYGWDLRAFLKKHNIKDLVAGNFYTSKSDWGKLHTLLTFDSEDYETGTPSNKIM